jgi:hypothetical protein
MGTNAAASTTTRSANAPNIAVPVTTSPTTKPDTAAPISSTTPANSLPGTNGGGTLT